MGSESGRTRVARPLSMCLQADEQGALSGDQNSVKIAARMVCRAYEDEVEKARDRSWRRYLDSVVDVWVMLEHPKAWDFIERGRDANHDDGFSGELDDLSADDMDEMIEKMRRIAGMS